MLKYNTLDLDFCDKDKLNRIIQKISKCAKCLKIEVRDTMKGYHVKILCNANCDLCRFVFDDNVRYALDIELRGDRPHVQNILFNKKYAFNGREYVRYW